MDSLAFVTPNVAAQQSPAGVVLLRGSAPQGLEFNFAQAPAAPAASVAATGSSSFAAAATAGAAAAFAALGFSGNSRKRAAKNKGAQVVGLRSSVARRALDQSSRYCNLSLKEEDLIREGKHVLVTYIMKPKSGYDYLATAAHFAAESSTGTNVNVCTTDDFTKSVDAIVYYIDPAKEEMKIAYPLALFDRNITDGRAMMCSFMTLAIGNNQGMGDVEYGKIHDFYFPPEYLRLFDGPSANIKDLWKLLGREQENGGLVVGTIIKPKLGLQPKPFGEACHSFWQGGDFIKNDEPQGNQTFCQMQECIPEVVKAMKACIKETGQQKIFSANITADDPNEMIARGEYILSQFGPLAENVAFLVDGYVAGGTAVTVARRNFPRQFLHYHRAGHGAVTSPQSKRGYTAFVHTKMARILGASGIHVGTMSFGKMEGELGDKNIAYMLQQDSADGPYYHQEWEGMKETTPIISGGMNALRLPGFFDNLGHSNVILTAGGGSFGHKDGPKSGAISCRQAEEAWENWKDGKYGNVPLSEGVIEYAKTHEELKGAFLTFQNDADQIYPGWKEKLGYTGESNLQASGFSWKKKPAAAAFVGQAITVGAGTSASQQQQQAASRGATQARGAVAMQATGNVRTAINGFGRIGRNVFRCWLQRDNKPFDIVAINIGSMPPKTAAHLLKYDTVLGTLKADVSYTDDALIVNGKEIKIVTGRDPAKMPWGPLNIDIVIESTGAFNNMDGASKHVEAGAKKVVITAPGKNCPTFVMGVNEGDYDSEKHNVISNASCTTNGMAPVCKVLDETFGVEYGVMTTTHAYTGDQMILDGRHKDLRRARAGAMNIIPTTTGAAQAVALVLPQFKGKLNGIALRVPTPNVSVIDFVVKTTNKCTAEDVNAALKKAAEGPMKGIINFEEQPLVSSDFMQSDYSNSVDAALTMVMGGDMVKVVLWYDNEWGYSQRVVDLTSLVSSKM
mmetsp:Transcript_78150/g.171342  ORF Transcript_78150/g.171342 Transcript_78150/m.171342 type:complete len:962 (-) Transcript_78150:323-3208(-)|eukprot:CAMPEP_0206450760 /NCGR_PEP_ID=MMETSP0324_2-20121206/18922_1 /ASSEMBLY_ACC=CAM_ASM_000836 /TAXON_ID=2866 /ORGANISM="Crypthecodinium cohnii, Strain Seligo" /LENGTH=961 /DNA_ID=CAMNT_0053920481 /DNA_START=86 /DNA_END=2971 /DNA_ORIENTATION=+